MNDSNNWKIFFAAESSEGRFGFILKENTLETILQDQYLEKKGWFRARIPRDGNCLFRAFAQAVFFDQGKQRDLRNATVDAMDRDWTQITQQIGVDDKETYLTAMRQNGTYGGEPEIQVLCRLLSVRAVVRLTCLCKFNDEQLIKYISSQDLYCTLFLCVYISVLFLNSLVTWYNH